MNGRNFRCAGAAGVQHIKQQWPKWLSEGRAVTYGHSAESIAMIAVLKCDKIGPLFATMLPILKGHFNGNFNRGRSIIGEKHSAKTGRRNGQKLFRQPYRR